MRTKASTSTPQFPANGKRPAVAWASVLISCVGSILSGPVLAQGSAGGPSVAEPDTQAIVEALKPAVTRRTRNLLVRPAAPAPEGSASAAQSAATVATKEAAEPPSVSAGTPASAAATEPRIDLAIRFDFNSARLRPESATLLASLASALVSPDLNGSRFLIEGHTDAQGTAAYNQRLSQLRAVEVQRFLVTHGVANNRLSSAGRGASDPANSAEPLAAENRRVRVVKVE